ncbi:type VI secretion system baseplate subunit TssE [Thalassoglobus sp. JC818]|uniref:type VI secretion system baseplate subunit TssE n=1 Tax=Thalassoglobus sp. JC818 TaxID=3232136 RepID=UPI00345A64E7
MSQGDRHRHQIRQSVLDRLMDDEPDRQQDDPVTETQLLRKIEDSVRRDVEDLLNTKYRCQDWPPQFDSLEDSLINYGLPDFTAAGFNAINEPDVLISSIKTALRLFEPRLKNVRVEKVKNPDYYDRTFRFRILATLVIESLEQDVRFDSIMESASGQFEVG